MDSPSPLRDTRALRASHKPAARQHSRSDTKVMQRRVNTGSAVGYLSVAARRLLLPPGQARRLWPLVALALAGPAGAQSPASPPAAATPAPSDTASRERLQREAERPMYWIRVHAEQARAAEARKSLAAPAPSAPTRAAKNAPSPFERLPATAAGPAPSAAAPAIRLDADTEPGAAPEPMPAIAESAGAQAMASVAGPAPSGASAQPIAAPAAQGESGASVAVPMGAAAPGAGTRLELLVSSEPDFPAGLVRRLRRGELQVEVEVAGSGEVSGAKVLSSSHPRLNEPALQAIRSWRFKPPSQPANVVIHFKFDIDDAS